MRPFLHVIINIMRTKLILTTLFSFLMLSPIVNADDNRRRLDIRDFRNNSSRNNTKVKTPNNNQNNSARNRINDRQNARNRMRDFFCSRSGRCRPGDPQVDELSTMAMGLSALGFVSIVLYRERREKFEIKNDNN